MSDSIKGMLKPIKSVGKGDGARSCHSNKFKQNYAKINWGKKKGKK